MYNDVMVDLETLGQTPGCVILSIGAVAFNPRLTELGPELYSVINTKSCQASGLTEDESTKAWWNVQAPEARAVIEEAEKSEVMLEHALIDLRTYLDQFGLSCVRVWGNGSDFDNAILACAYRAAGLEFPWKFWNNRCYRTLKELKRSRSPNKRHGTYHNALDDAKTQALHAVELLK